MQRNRPPLNCNFIQFAQSSKTICSLPIIFECQTFCHNWCNQVAILNGWPRHSICSMYFIGIVFVVAYSICNHLGYSIRVYPEFQWNVDNDIIQLNSNNTPKTAFKLFHHPNAPDNIYFIDLIRSLHLQLILRHWSNTATHTTPPSNHPTMNVFSLQIRPVWNYNGHVDRTIGHSQ